MLRDIVNEDIMLWSVVVIGSAGIATGVVGVLLPAGRRIEVLLALIAGAGSGLATFAGELLFATDNPADPSPQFLYASLVGFVTVAIVLAALVYRDRRARLQAEATPD